MSRQDGDCVEQFAYLVGIVLEKASPTRGMVERMLTGKYLKECSKLPQAEVFQQAPSGNSEEARSWANGIGGIDLDDPKSGSWNLCELSHTLCDGGHEDFSRSQRRSPSG